MILDTPAAESDSTDYEILLTYLGAIGGVDSVALCISC